MHLPLAQISHIYIPSTPCDCERVFSVHTRVGVQRVHHCILSVVGKGPQFIAYGVLGFVKE
jgi:hypothetical protein